MADLSSPAIFITFANHHRFLVQRAPLDSAQFALCSPGPFERGVGWEGSLPVSGSTTGIAHHSLKVISIAEVFSRGHLIR
jgi:hypothetical protein